MLNDKQRETVGVGICVATALGYAAWLYHGKSATLCVTELGLIWFQVANWLGHRGALFFLRPKQIAVEAQRGSLRLRGTAKWIDRGADVLLITAAINFFATRG